VGKPSIFPGETTNRCPEVRLLQVLPVRPTRRCTAGGRQVHGGGGGAEGAEKLTLDS